MLVKLIKYFLYYIFFHIHDHINYKIEFPFIIRVLFQNVDIILSVNKRKKNTDFCSLKLIKLRKLSQKINIIWFSKFILIVLQQSFKIYRTNESKENIFLMLLLNYFEQRNSIKISLGRIFLHNILPFPSIYYDICFFLGIFVVYSTLFVTLYWILILSF